MLPETAPAGQIYVVVLLLPLGPLFEIALLTGVVCLAILQKVNRNH